jgi:hypothetical protein
LASVAVGASAYHSTSPVARLRNSIWLEVRTLTLLVRAQRTPSRYSSTPVELVMVHSASNQMVPVTVGVGRLAALSMVMCLMSRL